MNTVVTDNKTCALIGIHRIAIWEVSRMRTAECNSL